MIFSPKISKPVVIIGCPRSGTSLLFRILNTSKDLWSLYRESNDILYKFLNKFHKRNESDTLTGADLNNEEKSFLLNEFQKHSLNNFYLGYIIRENLLKHKFLSPSVELIASANFTIKKLFLKEYRLVEKSPRNCFRIEFINKLFEDCKFIFLKRDGRPNVNSLIEGWNIEGKFKGRYAREDANGEVVHIKGYNGKKWKFVKPPEWRSYLSKPLEEVCAFQWVSANKAALNGLASIEQNRKFIISYEELTDNPTKIVSKICEFIEIPFSKELKQITGELPLVNITSKPDKNKWKKNIKLIENTYPMIEPLMKQLGYSVRD